MESESEEVSGDGVPAGDAGASLGGAGEQRRRTRPPAWLSSGDYQVEAADPGPGSSTGDPATGNRVRDGRARPEKRAQPAPVPARERCLAQEGADLIEQGFESRDRVVHDHCNREIWKREFYVEDVPLERRSTITLALSRVVEIPLEWRRISPRLTKENLLRSIDRWTVYCSRVAVAGSAIVDVVSRQLLDGDGLELHAHAVSRAAFRFTRHTRDDYRPEGERAALEMVDAVKRRVIARGSTPDLQLGAGRMSNALKRPGEEFFTAWSNYCLPTTVRAHVRRLVVFTWRVMARARGYMDGVKLDNERTGAFLDSLLGTRKEAGEAEAELRRAEADSEEDEWVWEGPEKEEESKAGAGEEEEEKKEAEGAEEDEEDEEDGEGAADDRGRERAEEIACDVWQFILGGGDALRPWSVAARSNAYRLVQASKNTDFRIQMATSLRLTCLRKLDELEGIERDSVERWRAAHGEAREPIKVRRFAVVPSGTQARRRFLRLDAQDIRAMVEDLLCEREQDVIPVPPTQKRRARVSRRQVDAERAKRDKKRKGDTRKAQHRLHRQRRSQRRRKRRRKARGGALPGSAAPGGPEAATAAPLASGAATGTPLPGGGGPASAQQAAPVPPAPPACIAGGQGVSAQQRAPVSGAGSSSAEERRDAGVGGAAQEMEATGAARGRSSPWQWRWKQYCEQLPRSIEALRREGHKDKSLTDFLQSIHLPHVLGGLKRREKARMHVPPASINTDSIQCHILQVRKRRAGLWMRAERARRWVKKKRAREGGPPRAKRRKAKGSAVPDTEGEIPSPEAEQFKTTNGLYTSTCVQSMDILDNAAINSLVFVDPGQVYTWQAMKVPFDTWRQYDGCFRYEEGDFKRGGDREGNVQHIALKRSRYRHITGGNQHSQRRDEAYAELLRDADRANGSGWRKTRSRKKRTARRRGFQPPAVQRAEQHLSRYSLNVGDTATVEEAAVERVQTLLNPTCFWRFTSSKTHTQLRFERTMGRMRGLEALVQEFCPHEGDVLVIGDWARTGHPARKGQSSTSPIAGLRRHFSRSRRVLMLGESWTSAMAPCHRQRVRRPQTRRLLRSKKEVQAALERYERTHGPAADDEERKDLEWRLRFRPGRRTVRGTSQCTNPAHHHRKQSIPRDVAATLNFSYLLWYLAEHGGRRPDYLTSPA